MGDVPMKVILLIILLLPLPSYLLADDPAPGSFGEGFSDGQDAQRVKDEKMIAAMGRSCSDPSAFNLIITTKDNFNVDTCEDVIGNIEKALQDDQLPIPTENKPSPEPQPPAPDENE
jgi:hypothetical protein